MSPDSEGNAGRGSAGLAALILAAGAGRRFGGPKALARSQGDGWLESSVLKIAEAGITWIGIVLGFEAEKIREEIGARARGRIGGAAQDGAGVEWSDLEPLVTWIENPDWKRGRTGSIQRGLAALPLWATGVLIHQVDFPLVKVTTFRALVGAFESEADQPETDARSGQPSGHSRERILLPVHWGKRGHPIVVGRSIFPEIAQLGYNEPLHNVIRRIPARVKDVLVVDPGILENRNQADGPGS